MSSHSRDDRDRSPLEATAPSSDEVLPGEEGTRKRRIARRWMPGLGVVALAATGAVWYGSASGSRAPALRFATVGRGDVTSSVTATGTLNPVTQVQVGTQVSGQIEAIYADFNDHVKAGQLIARIDPTLLEQAVSDAEAGLERSQAALLRAQRDHERNRQLFESKILTETEFNQSEYTLAVAEADAKSARVAMDRARRNLAYTRIYAPINGVVVERNVDVGQTVAASFSAPQLFLIAKDLGEMEILVSVDESDIGEIHAGQPVTFTVQAYADTIFTGTVRQVRLQSTTTENIVNYTAVVQVANPTGRLLPGMTATVSFHTGSATDVLLASNAALRYEPSEAVLAGFKPTARAAALLARSSSTSRDGAEGTLWAVTQDDRLEALEVRVGVSDGRQTQVSGEGVDEGLRVIAGTGSVAAAESAAASPFQTGTRSGPPGPGF